MRSLALGPHQISPAWHLTGQLERFNHVVSSRGFLEGCPGIQIEEQQFLCGNDIKFCSEPGETPSDTDSGTVATRQLLGWQAGYTHCLSLSRSYFFFSGIIALAGPDFKQNVAMGQLHPPREEPLILSLREYIGMLILVIPLSPA